jgi:competence protein ComEC
MAGEVARRVHWRAMILAFAAGIAVLQLQPDLPGWRWLWLCAPLPVLASFIPPDSRARPAVWLLGAALAGFAYAAWRAEARLGDELDVDWSGRDVRLVGRVAGLPETTPLGTRFEFEVTRVATPGARVPGRVLLHLYRTTEAAPSQVRGGACLELTARLRRPHGNHNPDGFDYEAWLFERGVRAQGRVVRLENGEAHCPASPRALIDAVREDARARLRGHLGDAEYAGIVTALAIGDQNAITQAQWRTFRRTGVTHLMSISGLHVTLLGWLAFTGAAWAWRRRPGLAERWPARHAAAWIGLAVSAAYVAMAGFGIPAQRTLFMLFAVCIALALDRLHSASRVLAAALLLVLLMDPWAILAPGFWLSFGVVAALFFADAGRIIPMHGWRAWGRAQWVATLALLPVLVFLFQEFSLVSPLANAFAIPLVSLVAVPLSLCAVLLPWAWPAEAARVVIGWVMAGLDMLDALPVPVWHAAAPGMLAIALAVLGVAVLLLPRGLPGRWLALALFLPLVWPRLECPPPGAFWLQAVDVGQGLALVVRTHARTLVYDAGPAYASGENAGIRLVAPRLYAQGITRLDGMVVSHDDIDHSGGVLALLDSHAPAWVLSSLVDPGDARLSRHGRAIVAVAARHIGCGAGQTWEWDGVRFDVLYPPRRYHANPGFEDNDRSCVVRIAGESGSALLVGDLARLGEMSLLESDPGVLASDVLVVGHHGSASSSSAAFIAAVRPRHALVSVGQGNAFGHPDAGVLARLRWAGAAIWRTDRQGAVTARFEHGSITLDTVRPGDRRYWHEMFTKPATAASAEDVKTQLNPQW